MLWININGEAIDWKSPDFPAPQLRKSFIIGQLPRKALLRFAAPGWAVITVNGQRISDDLLMPAVTQLDKRTGVCEYEIGQLLTTGENVIGAVLGNGWFNCATHETWHFDKAPWRNYPRLALELESDGKIIVQSDESWKGAPGAIIFNQLRSGEHFDANLITPGWDQPGFDDSQWQNVFPVSPPPGILSPEKCPQCQVRESIRPVSITQFNSNSAIYDFGKNLTGYCNINVSAEPGSKITLIYSELLAENGDIDQSNINLFILNGDTAQTDIYIHGQNNPFEWHPEFVYHGFRYVKAVTEGKIYNLEISASYISSSFAVNGTMQIAHPTAAKLLKCTTNSFTGNFTGIPTDCPHREKNGWTGDAALACETGLWSFDAAANYDHYLQIIADAQRPNGQLSGIAPTAGWGYNWGSGPVWDAVLFELPYQIWQFTGDISVAAKYYPNMKHYLDYVLARRNSKGLFNFGLGDWCHHTLKKIVTVELTSTAYVCYMLGIAEKIAKVINAEDLPFLSGEKKQIQQDFLTAFRNQDGTYAKDEMTANACALFFGLDTSKSLARHLAEQVRRNEHKADFGIVGAKMVPRVLADYGYAQDAFKLYTQPEYPGWGNWIKRGATTLWEKWDGSASQTHIMFGDFTAWCFNTLAGIKVLEPGFKKIILRPADVPEAGNYSFTYRTPAGVISVRREQNTICYHIPEEIEYTPDIPASLVAVKE